MNSLKRYLKKTIIINIAKFLTKSTHVDSAYKQSKGIGWNASLQTEIKFLIGQHSENFTLFDIGANVGSYSLMVAKLFPGSTIYSFEPSRAAFNQLAQNVKGELSITPCNIGFGEEQKKVNLYSHLAGSPMASTYKRQFGDSEITFNLVETIEMDSLDNWVRSEKIIPDFIKIDAEGAELSILKGGVNTLKNVKAIQFEFGGTAIDAKNYFKDYWNFFTEIDFNLYRYTPIGLLEIKNYSEREEIFEFMNYLATPKK